MTERDKQFARTEALSDQRWAEFEEDLAEYTRIGLQGPQDTPEDAELVRKACLMVMAEIHRRRSYRTNQELAEEG